MLGAGCELPGAGDPVELPGGGAPVGCGLPGAGEVVVSPGGGAPVVVPGLPGEGDVVPGDGDVVPGAGELVPGDGEAVPGEGDAVPGEGDAVPGDGDAVPGDGDVVPGEGDVVPGDGEAVPGEGDVVPGEGDVAPGDGDVAGPPEVAGPDTGCGVNNEMVMPDGMAVKPGRGGSLGDVEVIRIIGLIPTGLKPGSPGILVTGSVISVDGNGGDIGNDSLYGSWVIGMEKLT